MADTMYDVVQIGYGPVGQTMAALLGKAGHKVGVFERWPDLFGKARAGHVDHEIMRIFQSVGAAEEVEDDAARASKYEFRNADGELLLSFDWDHDGISGWPSDYIVYQPTIETALDRIVRSSPTVELHQGWEVVHIDEFDDHSEITLRRVRTNVVGKKMLTDEKRTVSARYVIGADGANSFVRDVIGSGQRDLGFEETWLVLDLKPTQPLHFDFDNGQICDPARPHCLFQLGKRHRRFEFYLLPGESPEQMSNPDVAYALLAPYGITPDNADLVRHATYTFRSALADTWNNQRLFLVGDAAHVMPPFMGQGMCSGVRDAANLAWKLDLVLNGQASEHILDSYQDERSPHVETIIRMSIEAGRVSCTTDPDLAAARDAAFRAGDVPAPPPFPHMLGGILTDDTATASAALRGHLAPQGRIRLGDTIGRLDDVLGTGWTLLIAPGQHAALSEDATAVLERVGGRVINLIADTPGHGDDVVVDVDGYYADYFSAHAIAAIAYRPDFYIFGAASHSTDISALVNQIDAQVPMPVAAAASL